LQTRRTGNLDLGILSQQAGNTISSSRCVTDVAHNRRGILDLDRSHLGGCLFQHIAGGRQIGADDAASTGVGPDANAGRAAGDPVQRLYACDVRDIARQRALNRQCKQVGTPRSNGGGLLANSASTPSNIDGRT
jgi:hypothetical protein